MINTLQKLAIATGLAISMTGFQTSSAQALSLISDPVEFDFEITLDSGSLSGETFNGSFTVDETFLTEEGDETAEVTAFDFTFAGDDFDLETVFNPVTAFFNDGDLLGIDASNDSFTFVPGFFDASEAFFAFDFGSGDVGTGDFTAVEVPPIPEPSLIIDFETTLDSGSLSGEIFSGSFGLDDTSLTGEGFEEIELIAFDFNFAGDDFDLGNVFVPANALFLDGNLLGIDASNDLFSFIPGFFDISEAFFAFDFGGGDVGTGDFTVVEDVAVPEPTSIITILGLGSLGIVSKLKKNKK